MRCVDPAIVSESSDTIAGPVSSCKLERPECRHISNMFVQRGIVAPGTKSISASWRNENIGLKQFACALLPVLHLSRACPSANLSGCESAPQPRRRYSYSLYIDGRLRR